MKMRVQVNVSSICRQTQALLRNRTYCTVTVSNTELTDPRSYRDIPGPKSLPLVGNVWRFLPIIGEFYKMDLVQIISRLLDKYGKGEKIIKMTGIPGRNDMVFLFSPYDVEKAFRNEGQWPIRNGIKTLEYYRRVTRRDLFKGVEGIAVTNGKKWQEFRSKVNPSLMQPQSARRYVTPINDVAEDFIERIKVLRDDQGELPKDFLIHLNKWALESISSIALDTRLGCLEPGLHRESEPQKMIDAVQTLFKSFYELEIKQNLRHFTKNKSWQDLIKAMDTFNEVAIKYIKQTMERMKSSVTLDDQHEVSILERLLLTNDNPMVACVMALDMMIGGIDTTSNTTAIILHYLARNQDKQQKLFEEVSGILPSNNHKITSNNLSDMKYLKSCMKESMRLSPVVPVNVRMATKDMILSNYRIPKGVDFFMCHYHMSNFEKNFPRPDRFIPERWLKGDEFEQKKHPFIFMPFGFGPRMCIGRRFAELEIQTIISKIVRNFRVEYDQDLKMEMDLVNRVVSPLNFTLHDRS